MSARVLLVEDEPGLVMALSDLLTSEGYTVETATDGDTAAAKAEAIATTSVTGVTDRTPYVGRVRTRFSSRARDTPDRLAAATVKGVSVSSGGIGSGVRTGSQCTRWRNPPNSYPQPHPPPTKTHL